MYLHYVKRLCDVFGSLILLIVFSGLFLLIYLLYLLTFDFPILFRQERIGTNDRSFVLFKFRTLKECSLPVGKRRFPLGNILRFTSLDELPQLINVLRGEMSIIGPRPLPVEYLPLFSLEQRKRHLVRPGITGWAQVNGRHAIAWSKKFEYDLYYVKNVSFLFDLRILLKTIVVILSFRKDNSLEEKKFMGNA